MSITEFTHAEVRLKASSKFQQIPNFVVADEVLEDGTFVYADTPDGKYAKVHGQDERATHFVKQAGVPRVTADEIRNNTGRVLADEPVMAITGQGTVILPVQSECSAGQSLTVNSDGYATAWNVDSGPAGAFIVGYAVEDIVFPNPSSDVQAWAECYINLPAQWSPSTTAEGA